MKRTAELYIASNKVITQAVLYEYYCEKYDKLYGHITEEMYRLKDPMGRPLHRRHTKVNFEQFMNALTQWINMSGYALIRFDTIEYEIELELGMHKTE
jgi:hypothetical protein